MDACSHPIPALAIFAYIRYGILAQFSLVVALASMLPAIAYFGRSREFLKDVTPFATTLLCYEALQGITGVIVQNHSITYLSSLDRTMFGENIVGTFQKMFMSQTLTFLSSILYGLHFIMIAFAAVLLWLVNRRLFKGYALSMSITSYFALTTFVVLPTAPPWLAGDGLNLISGDSVSSFLSPIRNLFLMFESDKFAAFPSLHVAYALLFLFYVTRIKSKLCYLAYPITLGIIFSVIYLGQHYVIDIIGGAVYCIVSYLISERLLLKV